MCALDNAEGGEAVLEIGRRAAKRPSEGRRAKAGGNADGCQHGGRKRRLGHDVEVAVRNQVGDEMGTDAREEGVPATASKSADSCAENSVGGNGHNGRN